jgi:hypothetical protein
MAGIDSSRADVDALQAAVYDVFNGDADGLCALHQLRLAEPRTTQFVTGVKRDIALLQRVPSTAREVTVLDISLDRNLADLQRLLQAGCQVRYIDHHSAAGAFTHPRLELLHDESAKLCTSLLVDRLLQGRYQGWALAAAFGDNLAAQAHELAAACAYSAAQIQMLARLGELLNYNAYGETESDLHLPPLTLYRAMQPYERPLDFVAESPAFVCLSEGLAADLQCMSDLKPVWQNDWACICLLPCEPWARRVSGLLANRLMADPGRRACAVLHERRDGALLVSVRSAIPDARPADVFCRRFEGGGGRRTAAGIDHLPSAAVENFIGTFDRYFKPD